MTSAIQSTTVRETGASRDQGGPIQVFKSTQASRQYGTEGIKGTLSRGPVVLRGVNPSAGKVNFPMLIEFKVMDSCFLAKEAKYNCINNGTFAYKIDSSWSTRKLSNISSILFLLSIKQKALSLCLRMLDILE